MQERSDPRVRELERFFGDNALWPAALRVVDWLEKESPEHLTFEDLCRVGQVDLNGAVWLGAILRGIDAYLNIELVLVDKEGREIVLSPDAISRARETGSLEHPLGAGDFPNWETSTFPRFRPVPRQDASPAFPA